MKGKLMRLALSIIAATPAIVQVGLWDASEINEVAQPKDGHATITWTKDAKGNVSCQGFYASPTADFRVVSALATRIAHALENGLDFGAQHITEAIKAILDDGNTHVAWDETQKKFRNVNSMKEGVSTWELVGQTGMTVEGEDEKTAIRRAARLITDAMEETPEKAEKLCQWFATGRKVKLLTNGAIPTFTKIEDLDSFGKKHK